MVAKERRGILAQLFTIATKFFTLMYVQWASSSLTNQFLLIQEKSSMCQNKTTLTNKQNEYT